jgi:hypothetical protein
MDHAHGIHFVLFISILPQFNRELTPETKGTSSMWGFRFMQRIILIARQSSCKVYPRTGQEFLTRLTGNAFSVNVR